MICCSTTKPIKTPTSKLSSITKAFSAPAHDAREELVSWSPLTAGPYIVPVTRWIE